MLNSVRCAIIINTILQLSNARIYRTLDPTTHSLSNIESQEYNNERISIDFSTVCEGDIDPLVEIEQILDLFPCLSIIDKDVPDYYYIPTTQISRVYLQLDEDDNCLSDHSLIWSEYCIVNVQYDIMVSIFDINEIETTNNITYDNGAVEAKAWQLDFLDGVENDNEYKHYNGMELFGDREIDMWVLDTGIYYLHQEFFPGQIIDEDLNFTWGDPHGTGTSACAGGINYGVAKNFYIHDYPVCQYGGSCASSDIFAGLTKVLNYLQSSKGKRSVINMSIGTGISDVNFFTNIFNEIINAGGIIVVAAGNWDDDACLHNYAYYNDLVIAVGAHNASKSKSSYSSYGNCVHIYAPGDNVATAYSDSNAYVTQYKSGTSFSSPITVGKIANLLHENPTLSRNDIVNILTTQNLYPINGCTSGYCYGSYHNFSYNSDFIPGNYLKYEQNITVSISPLSASTSIIKTGIYSSINVDANATINGFSIRVDIIHPNRSNLILTLTSPNYLSIRLNASNSLLNEPNIFTIFFPKDFYNSNMLGTWTLNVLDIVGKYAGRLNYWNMKFYSHSPIIKIPTTTTTQNPSCVCIGSRKCTTYITSTDCGDNTGCYWTC